MYDNVEKKPLISSLIALFLVVIIIAIGYGFMALECNAKTGGMEMPHRWTLLGGCQVQIPGNWWIPLDNWYYRPGQGNEIPNWRPPLDLAPVDRFIPGSIASGNAWYRRPGR
jgi:hypothetical protein